MFKKRVHLDELIDSYTEEILSSDPINIKFIDLEDIEVSRVNNEIPVFSLLVLVNYLIDKVVIVKGNPNITMNYVFYKLDKKITDMRKNCLIHSTDIDDIKGRVFAGFGYKSIKMWEKSLDKYYRDKGMLDDGFMLCSTYVDYFHPYKDVANNKEEIDHKMRLLKDIELDEEEQIMYSRAFNTLSDVYKYNMNLFKGYRIKKLTSKEKKRIIKLLDEMSRKNEKDLEEREIKKKNKHRLSKEENRKVIKTLGKWLEHEQDQGRKLGLIYDKSKDTTKDED